MWDDQHDRFVVVAPTVAMSSIVMARPPNEQKRFAVRPQPQSDRRRHPLTGTIQSGAIEVSGGIVVTAGLGGTATKNNQVLGNVILGNQRDLFWGGSGTANTFNCHRCKTNTPPARCR